MAGRKGLNAYTTVHDPAHKLTPRTFGPDDEVPKEYADLIGAHLWGDGGQADDDGSDAQPARRSRRRE